MEEYDDYDDMILMDSARESVSEAYPPNVCRICAEAFTEDSEVVVEPCRHKFCRSCCEQHVKSKIMDQYTVHDVQCPGFGCRSRMEIPQLFSLIKKDLKLYEQMLQRSLEYYLLLESEARKCPTPDCCYAVLAPLSSAPCPPIDCPVCHFLFCYDCGAPSHADNNCPGKSVKSEALLSRLQTAKAIKCPRCSAKIEKIEGCDAIQCSLCKAFLCWGCGKAFETSDEAHNHNCKKELYDLRSSTAREIVEPDDSNLTSFRTVRLDQLLNSNRDEAVISETIEESTDLEQELTKGTKPQKRKQLRRINKQNASHVVDLNLGDVSKQLTDGSLQRTGCQKCCLVLFCAAGIIAVPVLIVLSILILPILLADHVTKKLTKNKFYYLKGLALWSSLVLLIPLASPFSLAYGFYWSSVLWYCDFRKRLFNASVL